ncbi:MAG: ubiquinol oxidase subunit II [Pantoea sp. Brub]|nr:ubiquinol oxidase subunit II [Pantoea sp. Brub]
MRFRKYFLINIVLVILSILLVHGCNIALLNPKGQIALEQRSLIITSFAVMLIVVIPAILMSIIFAFKYRESNLKNKYSPNWSHSATIEIIVWIVPICIIFFLSVLSWKSTHKLEPSKPIVTTTIKPIEIDVIALDWKWLFIYPKQRIATINQIVFPVNTPITFKITSNSVMNSFFIPRLGSQMYAMAGMETKLNLIANEPGIFDGISSNFSGSGFSNMKFQAIATKNNQEFQEWILKVKNVKNEINNINDFNKIAIPNENNKVEYFSRINPNIFLQVITKFNMHHAKNKDLKF